MRKSIRPQSRRHLWLYDEDWTYISTYVAHRVHLQPGSWVREMLHRIVAQIREEKCRNQEAASQLMEHAERAPLTATDAPLTDAQEHTNA